MDDRPDILILGSGIAGLSAAVSAAGAGLDVLVLTKADTLDETNTSRAQGGIVGPAPGDTPQNLAEDIIRAGSALNYTAAVRELSEHGPQLVDTFLRKKCRVNFALNAQGLPDLGREGAHSVRRIYHSTDKSGQAIHKGLTECARSHGNIRMETAQMAVDLITSCHHSLRHEDRYRADRVIGAYVLDIKSGRVRPLIAPLTVLATGGIGQIFLHSSNPEVATGDGIAMAYRAGVSVINAEYVQFHPTTLYHRDFPNFLISEALRGEGARLINRDGEAFMKRYAPGAGDLAPRDEVSRAICAETEQRGESHVYLDTPNMRGVDLPARFPSIYETCLKAGIDMNKDPVPVVPAAHYFCGGIKAGLRGNTSLSGLYAVGETACTGVHGANRLASVSLLEGLYSGVRCGTLAAESLKDLKQHDQYAIPEWVAPDQQADPAHICNDLSSVQGLMWNYAGIFRTKRRLQRALADLNYLNHRIDRFYREARPSRPLVEMRNAVLTASVIARSASTNRRSVGCHFVSE